MTVKNYTGLYKHQQDRTPRQRKLTRGELEYQLNECNRELARAKLRIAELEGKFKTKVEVYRIDVSDEMQGLRYEGDE